MKAGDLVIMDLPHQPEYGKLGVVLRVLKAGDNPPRWRNRITYEVLVDGVTLRNVLYEYFIEV